MNTTVQSEIDSYLRRFRQSLAALPATLRDDYADAVRARLEAWYQLGKEEQEESGQPEEAFIAEYLSVLKAAWPFTLMGLSSRGGLSNWVFFFLPQEVLMLDLGMAPAIKAGALAGLGAQPWFAWLSALFRPRHGPQPGRDEALEDWQAKLRSKAKDVQLLRDERIHRVRLRLRALAHQVVIDDYGAVKRVFQLMNRDEAESLIEPLSRRFGARFEVTSTPVFAFCKRYAPFLME